MKQIFCLLFSFVLIGSSGCVFQRGSKSDYSNDIQPYFDNPKYWQYKGKPVLLLGGSNNDNLFQSSDIEEQLNLLQSVGGNFVRNTMSSRDSGDVFPFYMQEDGKYDLDRWAVESWNRFENLLKLAEERDVIIQIEVWDRFDYSKDNWLASPFNPVNNINYSEKESGLADEYPEHPYVDKQPFFHSINGMPNYKPELEIVKKYQEKLVDKMLSYSLNYGNVLYCMNNETSTPPEWGKFWMKYIKNKAGDKKIVTTDMYGDFFNPESCEACKSAIKNTEEYSFIDVSQIGLKFKQEHYNSLQWIVNERNKYAFRPLNCVKKYGGMNLKWGSGSNQDGVDRFCRSVVGGCAATRHHRPEAGNGLNEKAQASIQSVRKVESLVKMWEIEPHPELLSERESDEAYLASLEGDKYVLLFPSDGCVKLDLTKYNKEFIGNWVSISTGEWGGQFSVTGGIDAEIVTPDSEGWFAVLSSVN